MKRQNAIQFLLFLIGLTLIIFTYFYYPNLNKTETVVEESTQDDSFKIQDDSYKDQDDSYKDQDDSYKDQDDSLKGSAAQEGAVEQENVGESGSKKKVQKKSDIKKSTTFENVKYKGLYDFDKQFSVEAENAYIASDDSDLVYMKNMEVVLYLSDGRTVKIISDQGRYNKATFDCFFENNVKATDGQTKIFSNNLDLLATKDFVEIYNDVTLNSPTGNLAADKIDYNFTTKYFKISMFDDTRIKMKVIR